MKRVLIVLGVVALAVAGCLTLCASRYELRVRPGVKVGAIDVSGLTREEAARKLRVWWEGQKVQPLTVRVEHGTAQPLQTTPSKAGFTLDDQAIVADLPTEDFWEAAGRIVGRGPEASPAFNIKLKPNGSQNAFLDAYVRSSLGESRPPRVTFADGVITRSPEISGYALDRDKLAPAIAEAIAGGGELALPIKEAPKRVPDEELTKIVEVMAEYTTRFPIRQTSRNNNLNLASKRIDGTVLMPGDRFSFNTVVGKRTIDDGYKLAGVYRNGKHDLGIGGGICQVSGTLYNAALLSNMKIAQRHNHSMPVAYLPVGRDATVDYGTYDLQFENPYPFPVAISRSFSPGKLTFRVLGVKDPLTEVKIIVADLRSWSRGVQYVSDGSLLPGKQKVIEKGSAGHSATTYRVVYRNGVEIRRELLSRSRYAGGPRIIARNPAAAPPPEGDQGASGTGSGAPDLGAGQ